MGCGIRPADAADHVLGGFSSFVPLIILYTGWVYRVLRGKITVEMIEADNKTMY